MSFESKLISRAEGKEIALCEGCGLEIAGKPWPQGWRQCGRSLRRIAREGDGAVSAWWCPNCDAGSRANPTRKEIQQRRRNLEAAQAA